MGDELATDGALAMLASILGILIHMAASSGVRPRGILSLGHTTSSSPGIFAYFQQRVRSDRAGGADDAGGGYSLNDTIVVFDRARENFRKVRRGDTAEIMDLSMRPRP